MCMCNAYFNFSKIKVFLVDLFTRLLVSIYNTLLFWIEASSDMMKTKTWRLVHVHESSCCLMEDNYPVPVYDVQWCSLLTCVSGHRSTQNWKIWPQIFKFLWSITLCIICPSAFNIFITKTKHTNITRKDFYIEVKYFNQCNWKNITITFYQP